MFPYLIFRGTSSLKSMGYIVDLLCFLDFFYIFLLYPKFIVEWRICLPCILVWYISFDILVSPVLCSLNWLPSIILIVGFMSRLFVTIIYLSFFISCNTFSFLNTISMYFFLCDCLQFLAICQWQCYYISLFMMIFDRGIYSSIIVPQAIITFHFLSFLFYILSHLFLSFPSLVCICPFFTINSKLY